MATPLDAFDRLRAGKLAAFGKRGHANRDAACWVNWSTER